MKQTLGIQQYIRYCDDFVIVSSDRAYLESLIAPIIWLDDDLWEDELKVLEAHNATDNFISIDLDKNPDQLKDIANIIQFSFDP